MYALLVTYGTVGVGVGVLLYGTDGNRLYRPFGPSVKKEDCSRLLAFFSLFSLSSLFLTQILTQT